MFDTDLITFMSGVRRDNPELSEPECFALVERELSHFKAMALYHLPERLERKCVCTDEAQCAYHHNLKFRPQL